MKYKLYTVKKGYGFSRPRPFTYKTLPGGEYFN